MVRARLLLLAPLSVVAALPPVTVPTISLGGGVELPYVAMGTGSGQKGDVEKATALWLGEAGGSAIDTAYEYFDQPEVAKGISAAGLPRSAVFLETKIPCSNYETATKDLESNLKQLAVRKVDLTLIHTTCSAAGASGTWKALEEFHAAGKSDAIGTLMLHSGHSRSCIICTHIAVLFRTHGHCRRLSLSGRRLRGAQERRRKGRPPDQPVQALCRLLRQSDHRVLQEEWHRLPVLLAALWWLQRFLVLAWRQWEKRYDSPASGVHR